MRPQCKPQDNATVKTKVVVVMETRDINFVVDSFRVSEINRTNQYVCTVC